MGGLRAGRELSLLASHRQPNVTSARCPTLPPPVEVPAPVTFMEDPPTTGTPTTRYVTVPGPEGVPRNMSLQQTTSTAQAATAQQALRSPRLATPMGGTTKAEMPLPGPRAVIWPWVGGLGITTRLFVFEGRESPPLLVATQRKEYRMPGLKLADGYWMFFCKYEGKT